MPVREIPKPLPGEYPAYAAMYIDLLPDDGRLLDHLDAARTRTLALARSLDERELRHRYAPGKWSVKEVLVHVVDDERIYAYRALRFARGDTTPLPGFEQDAFAAESRADERPLESILDEYVAVRAATMTLFSGIPEEALLRSGEADGKRATVRALGYHIAGHEAHHLRLLATRYLRRELG